MLFSITALTGLTGNGKSYSAVELFILQAAKEGRPVVTNIPLTQAFYDDFPGAEVYGIDMEEAGRNPALFDSVPGGALCVFDELWRIWPAGLKPSDIPAWQLSFIKESRHRISKDGREMDVVLVTQNLGDIASAIRDMADVTIICNKLVELGAKNRFRRDYYRGAIKGIKGPKAAFFKSDHGCKYDSKIYRYYKSHTKGETTGAIDNSGVVNASIFTGWGFRLGVAALAVLLALIFYSWRHTAEGVRRYTASKPAPVAAPAAPPASSFAPAIVPVAPPPLPPPPPPRPPNSKTLRICGYMSGSGADGGGAKVFLCQPGWHAISISYRHHCSTADDGEIDCLVEGERVTRLTGIRAAAAVDAIASGGFEAASERMRQQAEAARAGAPVGAAPDVR